MHMHAWMCGMYVYTMYMVPLCICPCRNPVPKQLPYPESHMPLTTSRWLLSTMCWALGKGSLVFLQSSPF
jgi:hypothetical protein